MSTKPIDDEFEEKDDSPEHIPTVPFDIQKEREKEEARKLARELRKNAGNIEPIIVTKAGLTKKASEYGVQVMIEGPGHVPIKEIEANVKLEKSLCNEAPFYVLGPIPTDIAPGYDHITAAVGGAIAASAGADFLCYVTPAEHLRLPNIDEVKDGIIASRIAAHIADIAKGVTGSFEKDLLMAKYRDEFNWGGQIKLSIDPEKTESFLEKSKSADEEGCTMCGEFCAIKLGKAKK